MPYVPKSTEEQFTSDWSKAIAWAQGQGISTADYAPVYQLDVNRLQNGEYPMSSPERNLEILAASNPNKVTSAPSDQPSATPTPSNIWHNAVSDAGSIATGLIGIFTGSFEKQVWDSAKATYEGITHPASLDAPTAGGTIANWLDKTVLSYLPGATDLGTLLTKGPAGLAEHPLVSMLDLMGAEGGVAKVLDHVSPEMAASLAEKTGGKGVLGAATKAIGGIGTGKAGVTLAGELVDNMSVKDVISTFAAKIGPGGAGVGKAIGDLAEARSTASAMSANEYAWLMDGPTQALKGLSDDQKVMIKKILDTRRTTGGDSVLQALDDPELDPRVKEALQDWLEGPLRFATEESIFSRQLLPIEGLDGRMGMWAPGSRSSKAVLLAKTGRDVAHREAMESLVRLAPHADLVAKLDQALPKAVKNFTDRLSAARQEVFADANLQGTVTQNLAGDSATRFRKSRGISKSQQVQAVVGEGGLADDFIKAVQEGHDPAKIEALATAMKNRLSKWGPKSVDAADSPALARLAATSDAFVTWAKAYQANAKAIDEAIHGEAETQKALRAQHGEWRSEQMAHLKASHEVERQNVQLAYEKKVGAIRSRYASAVSGARARPDFVIPIMEEQAENAAARATKAKLNNEIMPELRRNIQSVRNEAARKIRAARTDFLNEAKIAKLERDKVVLKMARKHRLEIEAFRKQIKTEMGGLGDTLRDVVAYGKAVDRFHQAVMDHPSDEYRDAFNALYEKHLDKTEATETLKRAASKYERDTLGLSEDRIAARRADPQVLGELLTTRFHEVFEQPTLDPQVSVMARAAMKEAETSAKAELKTLISQGLVIQYIPSAVKADEKLDRHSMDPVIGKGIPKPDMAKARSWEATPRKDDFALGINKAVVQALQRDATIELAEHTLRPLTVTQVQLANFIDRVFPPEDRLASENIQHYYARKAGEIGLTRFDPESMFGFRLPRWGKDETYLPTPLVAALKEMDRGTRQISAVAKSTKLFRYSILGLSPRYDAHIIFGGSMMLALRSTPYAIKFLGEAHRALRDGTLPVELSRHAVEEGFQEPVGMLETDPGKAAIKAWQTQAGRDLGNMAIGEHLERVQKIKAAAAKPVHVVKALADINFRFTRYVRDMQSAVAYLDGAAKYERKMGRTIKVEHPDSGRPIEVTPDRAVVEGMHHVQQVFGNLNRMSPFERMVAQSVMPFYGWEKHILGYVVSFPFDHPYRAMVLSQLANNSSNDVPLALPIRIQLLFQLGSPDSAGNVNAVDIRSLDPFRDVANYATWTGFFESLNPALAAPLVGAFGSGAVYGSSSLYPSVTYNQFYGIETASSGGNFTNMLEQWVPQVGAAQTALDSMSNIRSTWNTDRPAAIKSILSSLNIPFVTPPINVKQIAATDEGARFETAKTAAYNAFSSGDFSLLNGYTTVPNPLNTAYEITPTELQTLYNQALQANPGVAPIESLLPPTTPAGW